MSQVQRFSGSRGYEAEIERDRIERDRHWFRPCPCGSGKLTCNCRCRVELTERLLEEGKDAHTNPASLD